MKKIILLGFFAWASIANGQTAILSFDGNDMVDLGPSVGNGIRTVECWFRLDSEIDATITDYITILSRDDNQFNLDEFNLAFQKNNVPNPGTLRFSIALSSGNERNVYSNANYWAPEKWYHVAVCIDATNGMSMYIDGVKQSSTHTYADAPANSSVNTVVGNWGILNRYFTGKIEDVHFASEPLYSADFTPPCPNRVEELSTVGLYHFNEGTGGVTADVSGNQVDGAINGATWGVDFICSLVSINENEDFIQLNVYPNPTQGLIEIGSNSMIEEIFIKDINGRLIMKQLASSESVIVDFSNITSGTYFVEIKTINGIRSNKIVKL